MGWGGVIESNGVTIFVLHYIHVWNCQKLNLKVQKERNKEKTPAPLELMPQ